MALDATYPTDRVYSKQGTGNQNTIVPTGVNVRVESGGALDVESGAEIDVESGGALKIAGTDVASEVGALSGVTATAAEINKVDGLAATAYPVVMVGTSFTESAATTYTGTVVVPAGAILQDIGFVNTVLWGASTATLVIGDGVDPNGWLESINIKATEFLVGEVFQMRGGIASAGFLGKIGDYTVAATSRIGLVTSGDSGVYYGSAGSVVFVISAGTPSTTGRSFGWVTYCVPTMVASTDT